MTGRFLLCILFASIASCAGRRGGNAVIEEVPVPVEEQGLIVFDLEGSMGDISQDITINSLAEDISYIPLETGNDFLLPDISYKFAKIKGNIFIQGGFGNNGQVPIYQFDSLGRYVKTVVRRGRGPGEIPRFSEWYANANLNQINAIGYGKQVIVSLDSGEKSDVWFDGMRGYDKIPLNDSTFVSSTNVFSSGIHKTYLYFTDRHDSLINSIERNDELSGYNVAQSEGYVVWSPYEKYWLVPHYQGDAIFHDIFNDTLYRIKSHQEIIPHMVFQRGKLMPDPKDKFKSENKKKQLYVFHLIEGGGYVFLRHYYNETEYYDVWSKRDGSLAIRYVPKKKISNDFFVPFKLPDSSVIALPVVYADKDHVYGILEAFFACKFLPGIKEDDNPVVVVMKLKQ